MAKRVLVVIATLALVACGERPERTIQLNNIQLNQMFQVDGCTIYRFHEYGYARYFGICTEGKTLISVNGMQVR